MRKNRRKSKEEVVVQRGITGVDAQEPRKVAQQNTREPVGILLVSVGTFVLTGEEGSDRRAKEYRDNRHEFDLLERNRL